MNSRIFEKIILWIVKIGLWVIPFLPLYISGTMLFPFITGKNFTFRILTEILFMLWVALAWARPEYRPRLSVIFKAVTTFIGILFLADLLGPNPYRSFFSNYERMEGFMMLGHLYLYFVMLVSVFKTRRDWFVFFQSTIIASFCISAIGLWQKLGYAVSVQGGFRIDSTIGNPTYLAAYLLFHIWLLVICLYEFAKTWWLRFLYGAVLLFELVILYFTATRGVTIALVAVVPLFTAAMVIWWPRVFPGRAPDQARWSARGRWIAGVLLCLVIIVPSALWFLRSSSFVTNTPALQRLTNLSFDQRTIRSRFQIWGMSAQAVREHPVLGWGQENYYLVFQKYFDPRLFDQEPWFDRSHNVIFDWLVHAGILGLASFFAILIALAVSLVRSMKQKTIGLWQGCALCALFVTYLVQNLFVFDNLNTYLLLFAFFAYTDGITAPPGGEKFSETAASGRSMLRGGKPVSVSFVVCLLAIAGIAGYFFHYKPMAESKALIRALQIYQYHAPIADVEQAFRTALSYNTFGDTEVREQLASITRGVIGNSALSIDERKHFVAFTVDELHKQIEVSAPDVKHVLLLGSILNDSLSLDSSYITEAERVLQEAIRLSPTKQVVYFEVAQFYLNIGDANRAADILRTAWKLDTSYKEAAANVLVIGLLAHRPDVVAEAKPAVDLNTLDEDILYRIAVAYQKIDDFASARDVYQRLIAVAPRNPRYHATYAAILAHFGQMTEARQEAETASTLDPAFKKESDLFLKKLGQ